MAYEVEKARLQMFHDFVQGKASAARAEAGRSLQGYAALAKMSKRVAGSDAGEIIKSVTGKDLFQAQREADYAGRLYTPEQVAQFVNDSRKDGFQDKIIYYYINALISGPLTHARYAVGNMINVLAKPLLITPVSAVAGRVGEAVGLQAPGDRVYMREAGAELYAIIKGSQDGIKAAVEAMKTGVSPPLPGERLMHEI